MKKILIIMTIPVFLLLNTCSNLGLYTSQEYCMITFKNDTQYLETKMAVSTSSYIADIVDGSEIKIKPQDEETIIIRTGEYYAFYEYNDTWYYNISETDCKGGKHYECTLSWDSYYGTYTITYLSRKD